MLELDELHIMYIGTLQYMIGSVLHILAFDKMPESPAENIQKVWLHIVGFYRDSAVATRYSHLSLSSFCP